MAGSEFNMLGQDEGISESTSALIGNGIGGLGAGEGRYGIAEDAEQALGPVRLDGGFQTRQLSTGGSGTNAGGGQQGGAQGDTAGMRPEGQSAAGSNGAAQQPQGATGINAGDAQEDPLGTATSGDGGSINKPLTRAWQPDPDGFAKTQRRRQRDMEVTGDRDPTGGGTAVLTNPIDPDSNAVRGGGGRYLTEPEKQKFREFFEKYGAAYGYTMPVDFDSIKIYPGRTPWFMPKDKGGITLENHVYLDHDPKSGEFDPLNNQAHFEIMVEEAAHVGQFQNGLTRLRYLWDGAKHGYNGHPAELIPQALRKQAEAMR